MSNEATRAQNRAADPGRSTWLSANAGSGKTRVLTDRVARLLLGGTEPQRILCLTYTRAAASEMQNRLFARLGRWAMQDEASLRGELGALGIAEEVGPEVLTRARRLFARAIETPGGLKIQTIHSFCAGLLRRFPLEAGVSPSFTELDDRGAALLRHEILELLAAGRDIGAVDALAQVLTGDEGLDGALAEIASNRDAFQANPAPTAIWQASGLPPGFDGAALLSQVFDGDEAGLLSGLLPVLQCSGPNDQKAAAALAGFQPDLAGLARLEGVLLTGPGAAEPYASKVGSFPTKAARQQLPAGVLDGLNALITRVAAARPLRIGLLNAERTAALHAFAGAFLPLYAERKAQAGALDFDDLIRRASGLLSDRSVAAWVLYRLDGGIDHVLVDEAQDTSPEQWRVIERLTDEFTAGEGATGRERRIFVVGDAKQSIYSFQGAELGTFRAMADSFRDRHQAANIPFQSLELQYSFRSSDAILRVVDETFQGAAALGLGGAPTHRAFHTGLAGRVDLWEPVPDPPKPEEKEWFDPVDTPAPDHPTVELARRIADRIGALIAGGAQIPTVGGPRPVHAGDFLILVRRRGRLFHEIIRACKARGLAIAGADRMALSGELAVKDLTALLSFLATPDDSLSLAAVLRSPIFGWSEDALYRLAQGREGRGALWQALRAEAERHPATMEILNDLRDRSDFLRPYELVERVLTRHDARRRILGRLGEEAEDGLNAFLAATLSYERTGVPSLTGFLVWLASGDTEVKRRLDSSPKAIRVMTVHGAKGLEAPIVILPDTAKRPRRERGLFVVPEGRHALWKAAKAERTPEVEALRQANEDREREEDLRLLYVAMTRAESWLIVAAAGEVGGPGESWYQLVAEGAGRAGMAGGSLLVGIWPEAGDAAARRGTPATPLPDWIGRPPGPAPVPAPILTPTGLGGPKAIGGDGGLDEARAMLYGTALHRLLEVLPAHARPLQAGLAERLLTSAGLADPDDRARALKDAQTILDDPALGWLFAPGVLAEVPITAPVSGLGGARMLGTIDRLLVTPERVVAVDFKSNAIVPDDAGAVPLGILRQMGAYEAMLAQVYPGRQIVLQILWTTTRRLMTLPPNMVREALADPTLP